MIRFRSALLGVRSVLSVLWGEVTDWVHLREPAGRPGLITLETPSAASAQEIPQLPDKEPAVRGRSFPRETPGEAGLHYTTGGAVRHLL